MYIINSAGIAYHQNEVLYIIKPQGNARWRVMRYSPAGADDIRRTSRGDDMPSLRDPPKARQARFGEPLRGLDKKIHTLSSVYFLAPRAWLEQATS